MNTIMSLLQLSRIPELHWANRVEKTLSVYRESVPEKWQIERAAITIQAAYRSYFQRRQLEDIKLMNQHAQKIQVFILSFTSTPTLIYIVELMLSQKNLIFIA